MARWSAISPRSFEGCVHARGTGDKWSSLCSSPARTMLPHTRSRLFRQTRGTESDYRHGPQTRHFGVSHAQVGARLRGQRHAVLRGTTSPATNPFAQKTSRQARTTNHRTANRLISFVTVSGESPFLRERDTNLFLPTPMKSRSF